MPFRGAIVTWCDASFRVHFRGGWTRVGIAHLCVSDPPGSDQYPCMPLLGATTAYGNERVNPHNSKICKPHWLNTHSQASSDNEWVKLRFLSGRGGIGVATGGGTGRSANLNLNPNSGFRFKFDEVWVDRSQAKLGQLWEISSCYIFNFPS